MTKINARIPPEIKNNADAKIGVGPTPIDND